MKKLIVFLLSLIIIFFISGCIQKPPVCGNRVCEPGENFQNCPQDCSNQTDENKLIGQYCDFDLNSINSTQYSSPEKYPAALSQARLYFDYCNEKMPLIINELDEGIGQRKALLQFSEGPAGAPSWTVGDDRIFINSTYYMFQPAGFLLHEGTHFVQNYGARTGNRSWVMEGLADLVRFKLSRKADAPDWAIGCENDQNYQYGYGCAAAFFHWIGTNCNTPNIASILNKMMLEGSETDKVLNQVCGKSLEQLWQEYKLTNPPERIYPPE